MQREYARSWVLGLFNALMLAASWKFQIVHSQASPFDYWSWVNPQANANSLFSIAYGNGVYVAVGDRGTVQTSHDGVHWKNKSLPISDAFGSVTFGNGVFVAYLFQGDFAPSETAYTYLFTSADGENWNPVFSEGHVSLYGRTDLLGKMIYTNGLFVVVGGNASFAPEEKTTWILTSPDGTNWTTRVHQPGYPLYAVTYAQNKFVAVGEEGQCMTSSNGTSWSSVLPPSDIVAPEWVDILYHNGRFVALGNTSFLNYPSHALVSSNGIDWASTGPSITDYGLMRKISISNGKLLVTGEKGQTFMSDDATNWTPVSLPAPAEVYDAECFQGATVLVGGNGSIWSAPDGQTWSLFPPRFSDLGMLALQDFASDGNCLVTVGANGFVAWSLDGQSWIKGSNSATQNFNRVTYGNGRFVAVGDDLTIIMSTNGHSWQTVFSHPTSANNLLMGVAWNGSQFTAAGFYGYTLTSSNGIDWDLHQPGPSFFWSVTAGNGLFVANQGPNIMTSTDGVNWTVRGNSGGPIMRHGLYANGRFVLAGDIGVVMTSTNGMDWVSNSVPFDGLLTRVCFAGNQFITVGEGGAAFTSADGVDWETHLLPSPLEITSIGLFRDRLILGGINGIMLLSDPVSGPDGTIRELEWLGNNRVRLDLLGKPGDTFQVQQLGDLQKGWSSPMFQYSPLGRSTWEQSVIDSIGFFRAPRGP